MIIQILLIGIHACLLRLMHDIQSCYYRLFRHTVERCIINGRKTLIYQAGLEEYNTTAYRRLSQYAQCHGYLLKEDQRRKNQSVANDRRTTSVSILILTFGLISKNVVYADTQVIPGLYTPDSHYQNQIYAESQINELLAWITQKISPYNPDVTLKPPRLMNLPRDELYKMAFGKDLPLSVDKLNSKIYGLYNFKDETIYLLDTVDLTTSKGKSILLHELVHYIQYQNGYHNRVMCKNQLEYLAYFLESQYMQEQGERVSFTQDHLRRVIRCAN